MRVGVLGGTFDPPHIGHLIVASDVCEGLALDRLLFVPAATPPHKQGRVLATAEQRLEMVRAATAGDDRFVVDDVELRRGGESYSVDTLRELRAREPDAEIFFIIGVDQLREFDSWREPGAIVRLATLVVASRAGEDAGAVNGVAAYPVLPVRVTRIDLSATDVRNRVRDGVSIRYLVPDAVIEVIEREGLYREG
jgi:nicotinate-nucleotide adenylyltransferase